MRHQIYQVVRTSFNACGSPQRHDDLQFGAGPARARVGVPRGARAVHQEGKGDGGVGAVVPRRDGIVEWEHINRPPSGFPVPVWGSFDEWVADFDDLDISELTRATAEAVVSRNENVTRSLDQQVESEMGKKERALGALRQHRSEHGC
jgi:hypothetical protein